MDKSFDALLLILTAVRNARLHPALTASVDIVSPAGERTTGTAVVSHRERTWKYTDSLGTITFTPEDGARVESRAGTEVIPRDRDDWLPEGIAPFFPLAMPFWGGVSDNFRVVNADAGDGGVRLSLVHLEDPKFTGSAFVNTRYGVVTEFETPAHKLFVRDLTDLPL